MSDWKHARFEDSIEPVTYTKKVQRKDFLETGRFPIVSQEEGLINGYWDNPADVFRVSTPLVVFGDHTKVLKYVDFDFVLGADGVKLLQPRKFLLPRFFFYQLQSLELGSLGSARHYRLLREHELRYPPLAEQRRIVGILDEAFEGIAAARTRVEANLANAGALFESLVEGTFTQHDASHPLRMLGEVCEITVGHVGPMAKEYKSAGVPFLRSQNIRPYRVSLDGLVFIDEAFHRSLAKSQLRPGDVAVVRTGYPGTAAVVPESLPISNCSDLVIVRPSSAVDPQYLALFFNSAHGKRLVAGQLVGAAQKHFNVGAAKQVLASLPSVAEQRRVATRLGELSVETERLASLYRHKLAALDELKRSLLHHAFTGRLTERALAEHAVA